MNRHPVPDTERYAIVNYSDGEGVYRFTNWSAVNPNWGYRGCGVFSCKPDEKAANVAAIKRGGVKVFDARTGAEI